MIFPELGPKYMDEQHKSVKERFEAFYSQSITINQQWWGEADTDLRFYSNDQELWNSLYGNLPASRRRNFAFNRIRATVDMPVGYQIRNRKSTVAIARRNGSNKTADQFTKLMSYQA